LNSEQELVFAKVLVGRRVASADALKECLRAQTALAHEGREVPLEALLVERGVVARDTLAEIKVDFERRLRICEACGAFYYEAPEDPPGTLCRRCSGLAAQSGQGEGTGAFRRARFVSERLRAARGGAPPSAPAADSKAGGAAPFARPGELFGDYEILDTVARGGMGVVFKARHKELRRVVALKVLREGRRSSEDHVRRFKREAQAVAKLQHPHIVRIHEFGHHAGQYFFTMDFVEGRSFEGFLQDAEREVRRGVEIVRDVARAMHFAHANGVIHRDLKPANILLDADGAPRITDFGLARNADQHSALTQEGELLGTPLYMSPEQVRGRVKEVDERSDVYALGVILYQHLAGQLPFMAQTMVELQWKVVNEEPRSIRKANPVIEPALETIVAKCLEKRREDRYQTAGELADDLERWLAGEKIKARGLSTGGRILRRVRRNRAASVAACAIFALLLVAGAIVGVTEWRARRDEKRAAHERLVNEADADTAQTARAAEALLETARADVATRGYEAARKSLEAAFARITEAEGAGRGRGLAPEEVAAINDRHGLPRLRRDYLELAAGAAAAEGAAGLPRARALLEQLVALAPSADAWVSLARVRRDLGDDGAADDAIRRALALDPRSAAALRFRGDAFLARRRWKDAEEALTSALEARAGASADDLAAMQLARAIARYELEKDDLAREDLRQVLSAKPTEPLAFIYRGELALRAKDRAAAGRDFDQAIELAKESAEAHLHRGRFLLEEGEYARAREDLQLAIDADSPIEAYLWHGVASYYLADDTRAEEDLAKVAADAGADEPIVRAAWTWLGRLRRATRRGDGAIEAYEKAVGLFHNPTYKRTGNPAEDAALEEALTGLGRATLAAGRDGAGRLFAAAWEIGPNAPAAIGEGLLALAASEPDPTRSVKAALASFERALELAPRDAEALAGRAEARFRLGEKEAGTAGLLAAYRADAATADVRWFLRQGKMLQGLAAKADTTELDRAKKLEQALRYFDRVAALVPSAARAQVERARILLANRRERDAIGACEAAIAANRCALDAYAIRGRILAASDAPADLDLAIADLSRALELGVSDHRVRYSRGVAYLKRGAMANALADLEAAAEAAPGDAAVFGQLQTAYVKSGNAAGAAQAKAHYQKLTDETKAKQAQDLAARADRLATSDPKAAIDALAKAIELLPEDGDLYLRRAYLYLHGNDAANALPDLARAIELRPSFAAKLYDVLPGLTQLFESRRVLESGAVTGPGGAFLRGLVYVLRSEGAKAAPGDAERGIAEFTAALDESPTSAAAYAFRGLLAMRSGDLKSAKDDLLVALMLESGCTVARVYMAGVHAQEGHLDLAFAYLKQGIDGGFRDWAQLARDPALAALRIDKRWKEIVR
jgi:tetratricopeptide (TPR) repeat protein/tRNA A-37 threonylcarbamoyl transferase component Bud32